jgi:hypothetical protein
MKRLPVLAFAAGMALWGLASIPSGGGDGPSRIDGVASAAAHRDWRATGAPRMVRAHTGGQIDLMRTSQTEGQAL